MATIEDFERNMNKVQDDAPTTEEITDLEDFDYEGSRAEDTAAAEVTTSTDC